jgi:hypothetical protein
MKERTTPPPAREVFEPSLLSANKQEYVKAYENSYEKQPWSYDLGVAPTPKRLRALLARYAVVMQQLRVLTAYDPETIVRIVREVFPNGYLPDYTATEVFFKLKQEQVRSMAAAGVFVWPYLVKS